MRATAHMISLEGLPDCVLRWDFYYDDNAVHHIYWWDELRFGLYLGGGGAEVHNWQFIQLASEA